MKTKEVDERTLFSVLVLAIFTLLGIFIHSYYLFSFDMFFFVYIMN